MNVDARLIGSARELLERRFGARPGVAVAAYSRSGRLFEWTARPDGLVGEKEHRPLADVIETDELIVALISLARERTGEPARVRAPDARMLDRLQECCRRHAQIAVSGSPDSGVRTRPLWELVADTLTQLPNTALTQGRYGDGMKPIARELTDMAARVGAPRAREAFAEQVSETFADEAVRTGATHRASEGGTFPTPMHLESISLRHAWLAFERAAERFVYEIVDRLQPELAMLGCNAADVVHVKQGFEALRNAFAVLVLAVGDRGPVANESPFYPYASSMLRRGDPIDRYLRLWEMAPGQRRSSREVNGLLVNQLADLLTRQGEGGFVAYIQQRGLYRVDLFNGGGTRHCPFAQMSNAMLVAAGNGIDRASREGSILLGRD